MTNLNNNHANKKKRVFAFSKILLLSISFSFLFSLCTNRDDEGEKNAVSSEDRARAGDINKKLGRGMNMGNAFEAPSEAAWGNPWKPEYFKIMADMGFTHVRVPIRWEPADRSLSEPPYTIFPDFLDRIKTVVDEALKNNLYVIINMHHHEELNNDPTGQHDRFLAQWEQISAFFQSYSDKLLFEIFNEPTAKFTAPIWNLYMRQALNIIRKTNPDRIVLIGTAEGGVIGALRYLVLPEDKNIILTIHYYNPFNFTHQGSIGMEQYTGTQWYDSEKERDAIRKEFETVKTYVQKYNNIPVHIGEFGANENADIESRALWTTFLARWMEEQGYSWAYWEFSSGFGIYKPDKQEFLQALADALLLNPMPEPGMAPNPDPDLDPDPDPESGTTVYISNFSSNNDSWTLNMNGGDANGTLSRENDALVANITNSGGNGWHLQLAKTGIPLKKGNKYRCTLNISTTVNANVEFYLDDNGPNYQAFNPENFAVGNTKTEFYSAFTYTANDDDDARITFNIGNIPVCKFTLYSFKLKIVE